MYNLKDIMEMFRIPERTVRRHLKEGILTGTKIGGVWKFSHEDLVGYVSNDSIQKHLFEEELKDIVDYYNGFTEDKSEVIYMFIQEFEDHGDADGFLEVTKQFKNKSSLKCQKSGIHYRYVFRGQADDVLTIIKWCESYK